MQQELELAKTGIRQSAEPANKGAGFFGRCRVLGTPGSDVPLDRGVVGLGTSPTWPGQPCDTDISKSEVSRICKGLDGSER